ncbi:hypothetical protein AAHE18_11G148900 [Arachis hypogaea]
MHLDNQKGLTLKDQKIFEYLRSLKSFVQFCLASKKKNDMWYLDSRCSRHMTGKATYFIKLDKYDGGFVAFGDNGKGKIVAVGKVGKSFSTFINDVFLIDGLSHNLLCISQLCDLDYLVIFKKLECLVVCKKFDDILFEAKRYNNVYGLTLEELKEQNVVYFTSIEYEKWL